MSVALAAARRTTAPRCAPTWCTSPPTWRARWRCWPACWRCRLGFADGDSLAALLVAVIIFVTAAASDRRERERADGSRASGGAAGSPNARSSALGEDVELDRLRLRESAGRYFADVVVSVPPGQAVVEGHRAADLVESALEQALPGSDVVVHVEPRRQGLDLRDRVLAIALAEPLVKEAHDITIFEQRGVQQRLAAPEVPGRARSALGARDRRAGRAGDQGAAGRGATCRPTSSRSSARSPRAHPATRADDAADDARDRAARARAHRAAIPTALRLLSTDAGRVLFLTLVVDAGRIPDRRSPAGRASSRRSCASGSRASPTWSSTPSRSGEAGSNPSDLESLAGEPPSGIARGDQRLRTDARTDRRSFQCPDLPFAALTVAALALAGCGSSSSSQHDVELDRREHRPRRPRRHPDAAFIAPLQHGRRRSARRCRPTATSTPTGIVLVPSSVGRLHAGELLVSNFNDKAQRPGHGHDDRADHHRRQAHRCSRRSTPSRSPAAAPAASA